MANSKLSFNIKLNNSHLMWAMANIKLSFKKNYYPPNVGDG